MKAESQKPYSDKWYAITNTGEIVEGPSRQSVKHEGALHYILKQYSYSNLTTAGNQYDFDEFTLYNLNFRKAQIKINGVTLVKWTKEIWDRKGWGTKHVGFTISDKLGSYRDLWLPAGIESFIECFSLMESLSKFSIWAAYDLAQKVASQETEIFTLKEENIEIKKKLHEIGGHKKDIRKLFFVLYQEEIREGIQDLLNCDSINYKEIAKAFNLPLEFVRKLRKELKLV